MKRILTTVLVIFTLGLTFTLYGFRQEPPMLRSGDVIFQTSMSPQCHAVGSRQAAKDQRL
jgi:hypothetical protein